MNYLIVIAGGSASGKTTVADRIKKLVPESVLIRMDDYYEANTEIPFTERLKKNYDHPFAFDFELLEEHINQLLNNKSINKPIYSFITHSREAESEIINPQKIIILEGILTLYSKHLRNLSAIKLFVDTDSDERFIRRLKRDIMDRGRTLDSVVNMYLNTVKPMHNEFVEPTKKFADIIIPNGGNNSIVIELLKNQIWTMVKN